MLLSKGCLAQQLFGQFGKLQTFARLRTGRAPIWVENKKIYSKSALGNLEEAIFLTKTVICRATENEHFFSKTKILYCSPTVELTFHPKSQKTEEIDTFEIYVSISSVF